MKEKNELSYRDLKMICDTNLFDFETSNLIITDFLDLAQKYFPSHSD